MKQIVTKEAAVFLYRAVGGRIRQFRMDRKLTKEQFARATKCSQSHLQNIEDGTSKCPLHYLVWIADAYDVSVDELIPVMTDREMGAS
jgi:transcriptional regulator with XRE-family HTH domain